jgi:hypothetical protein
MAITPGASPPKPKDPKDRIQYAESIRKRLIKYTTSKCEKCGAKHFVTHVAEDATIDGAGLWRFMKTPGATMLMDSMRAVDEALKKRGF